MIGVSARSFAKVNLTLVIGRRRPDGFHEVDSVVQVIDLADELRVLPADEGVIDVRVAEGDAPTGPGNLIHRACRVFLQSAGIRSGARVELRKRIPLQAGLGGGSSNAAAAIVSLNHLFGCGFSVDQLARLAAEAGSDAPLFVFGGTSRVTGRGEIVSPLPDAPRLDLVVVKPQSGVPTAWAYEQLDRSGQSRSPSGAGDAAEAAVRKGDRAALVRCIRNDFDPVITALDEHIRSAKLALESQGAERVMLAGSGAAVFGIFESATRAKEAAGRLEGNFQGVWAVRTLTRAESGPEAVCSG